MHRGNSLFSCMSTFVCVCERIYIKSKRIYFMFSSFIQCFSFDYLKCTPVMVNSGMSITQALPNWIYILNVNGFNRIYKCEHISPFSEFEACHRFFFPVSVPDLFSSNSNHWCACITNFHNMWVEFDKFSVEMLCIHSNYAQNIDDDAFFFHLLQFLSPFTFYFSYCCWVAKILFILPHIFWWNGKVH